MLEAITSVPSDPREYAELAKRIGEAGERIYRERYQAEFEARYRGKLVAIDIFTERAFIASTMSEAGEQARAARPGTLVHYIRVGFPAAISRV
jgi:hypothetical protein